MLGDVTLAGAGHVVLEGGQITGTGALTIGPQMTVSGLGTIAPAVRNQGTLKADQENQTLALSGALVNEDLLSAVGGATMDINAA